MCYQVSGSSRSIADLNYFYSFDCWLRNNHLSVPLKIIVKGNIMYLVAQRLWYNCECVSDLKRKEISPTVEFISSDIRHFYWEPDILAVKVLRKSVFGRGIELEFSGVLNGYQEYLVSCDGKKTWQRSGQKYFWRLKRGINMLEVTAPDMNGLDSRCSYIIAELGS